MSTIFLRRGGSPSFGKLASDYAVGESVFLTINGAPTEFLVVQQGNPDAFMYDASCAGTWLLAKNVYELRQWHSSDVSDYKESTIHAYLNDEFFDLIDVNSQAAIQRVKIPFVNGSGNAGIKNGSNGLSTHVFLLSGCEVGWGKATSTYFPADGAVLSYFSGMSASDTRRVARLNGVGTNWWLRSPHLLYNVNAWYASGSGGYSAADCDLIHGVRPAVIISPNTLFDSDTNTIQ